VDRGIDIAGMPRISTPLPYIAMHIIKTECIGRKATHVGCYGSTTAYPA
jgi:hypothetical protein